MPRIYYNDEMTNREQQNPGFQHGKYIEAKPKHSWIEKITQYILLCLPWFLDSQECDPKVYLNRLTRE